MHTDTLNKKEIRHIYIRNLTIGYMAIGIAIAAMTLILSKFYVADIPTKETLVFMTALVAIVFTCSLSITILRNLLLKHHIGAIIKVQKLSSGNCTITIKRADTDPTERETAILFVPAFLSRPYLIGQQVEYITFMDRTYLCIL